MHSRTSGLFLAVLIAGFTLIPDITSANTQPLALTEAGVRTFFKDTPVMIEIARCESRFRQNNTDGTILRGGWKNAMVGVFQFYENVHSTSATALGYDLTTLEGNLAYAKHLYTQSGTTPWNSSKACWGSVTTPVSKTTLSDADISKLMKRIEQLKKTVGELQRQLQKKKKVVTRL